MPISLLQDTPSFLVAFSIFIGLIVGSFLNVVIYRLPKMMERSWQLQCAELCGEPIKALPTFNIATPRSTCTHCGHTITALENIPIFSYLALRGRCSKCRTPISPRYPIVEALTGFMSGALLGILAII